MSGCGKHPNAPTVAAATLTAVFALPGRAEPAPESVAPAQLSASVDKAVATTGDRILYEVVIERDQNVEVTPPEVAAEIAGFRVVDFGEDAPVTRHGRVRERRWWELRADLVGSYVLPKVTVTATAPGRAEPLLLSTSQIFVEVQSVLGPTGDAKDIRDIKPLPPPPPEWPYLSLLGVASALLALAGWWWWRGRPKTTVPPPVPHQVAFAALDRLRGTNFSDPEAVRRWHFALSEVVRSYVEARWGLNATDLTTEEIVARLASTSVAGERRADLTQLLRETDRVKFAGFAASTADIEATYERALGFIERTAPPREPAEAAAA